MTDITFKDYLLFSHSLNAPHFKSSNAYNFLNCEQKNQVKVGIFLVRTWRTSCYQNNSDLLKRFWFCIFSTSRFSEWDKACNLWYVTSSNIYYVLCLALWQRIHFFLAVSPDDYWWSMYSWVMGSAQGLTERIIWAMFTENLIIGQGFLGHRIQGYIPWPWRVTVTLSLRSWVIGSAHSLTERNTLMKCKGIRKYWVYAIWRVNHMTLNSDCDFEST